MGKYEELAFTFAPSNTPLEAVAEQCRDLIERPLEELPAGEWEDRIDDYASRDFDRAALQVEVDEAYGQVYLYGKTHATGCQEAWREWVLAEGIGDGLLAVVVHQEAGGHGGYGWAYEWDDDAGAYEVAVEDPADEFCHVQGDRLASGGVAGYRLHEATGVRPARYAVEHLVRWGVDYYISEEYYNRVDDVAVPEREFRAALDDAA